MTSEPPDHLSVTARLLGAHPVPLPQIFRRFLCEFIGNLDSQIEILKMLGTLAMLQWYLVGGLVPDVLQSFEMTVLQSLKA